MAAQLFPQHWAIAPRALNHIWRRWQSGEPGDSAHEPVSTGRRGAVAIVPIKGSLAKDGDWFGPGMRDIGAAIQSAADDDKVRAIVLDIDSPGGTVDGTKELADVVKAAAGVKPVIAYNDGLMASAAYWIGSQATRIIASEFSETGSIGTLMVHADYSVQLEQDGVHVEIMRATGSPDKAKPNMIEPMDDATRAEVTATLDEFNAKFHAAVKEARPQIKDEALTGKTYTAASAPTGLIDQVGSISTAVEVAKLLGAAHEVKRRPAASTTPARLTQGGVSMNDLIKSVAALYAESDFKATAIEMAVDGKTESEIAIAYTQGIQTQLAEATTAHQLEVSQLKEAHDKAAEAKAAEHAAELEALQAKLAEADNAREAAEAQLAAGGFRAAEQGDPKDTKTGSYTLIKYD